MSGERVVLRHAGGVVGLRGRRRIGAAAVVMVSGLREGDNDERGDRGPTVGVTLSMAVTGMATGSQVSCSAC